MMALSEVSPKPSGAIGLLSDNPEDSMINKGSLEKVQIALQGSTLGLTESVNIINSMKSAFSGMKESLGFNSETHGNVIGELSQVDLDIPDHLSNQIEAAREQREAAEQEQAQQEEVPQGPAMN